MQINLKESTMRRVLLLAILSTILVPATLFAQMNGNSRYVGVGGSWSLTDSTDPDDSPGANLKLGYHAHRMLDIEVNFDWIDGFEDSEGFSVLDTEVGYHTEMEIMTAMVGLKGYFPIPSDVVRLSVVAGGGLMYADYEVRMNDGVGNPIVDDDELDFCGKVGLALDVYATTNFSIGAEGNYTIGVEDLNGLDFWHFTLGVGYHF
jgi:hypothetical protein